MCDTNTESTFNFNTTEAKITKEVCQQFVAVRTGKLVKTSSLCKETKVMLARVASMDKSQGYLVRGKIDVTELTEESGLYTFQGLSEVIFQDNKINWGRVISFFYYAAVILEKLKQNGKEHLNDKVALWLAICVSKKLSKWIKEQGNGWVRI